MLKIDKESDLYTLFYYPNNASLAPHFLLHHMGLNYDLVLVDKKSNAQKSPAYLTLNPAGRIPTLIDHSLEGAVGLGADLKRGLAIFESPAICIHLCEQHPEHGLIPALGSRERPLFFQWLTYLNNTLQAELMVRYYPHRHTNDKSTIPNIVAAQDERIADALSVINAQLESNCRENKVYLLGDTVTACDFFLFMLAEWSLSITPSPLHFDYLAAYLKRLAAHPTVIAVCEIEQIDLTPFKPC